MNKEPTDKQIKEFLQWCGIQCYYKDETNTEIEAWICPPDSEKTIAFYGLTLDFLFKYAVPNANELGYFLNLQQALNNEYWKCILWHKDLMDIHRGLRAARDLFSLTIKVDDKNPALALFWALDKVRKGGE